MNSETNVDILISYTDT